MYQWTITTAIDEEATVTLNTGNPNETGAYRVRGGKNLVADLNNRLPQMAGAAGHLLGTATNAIDLDFALSQDASWIAELTEGELDDYDFGLEEGDLS